jgi:uncharacterized protein (TIGR00251 family)
MVENARIRFSVRITPKASQNAILGWKQDADGQSYLKISVTTVPEKGKANEALIALLSKNWKIPKSDIIIEKGDTDRHKILSVSGIHADMINTKI